MTILLEGHLPRTGEAYTLGLLDESSLGRIKDLHDLVIEALGPEEKTFLLPRTADYFARHFTRGSGSAVMGIWSGGGLIAKTLILHPGAHETTPEQLGGAILISPPESTSIMQAASVHPAWRGNGLMGLMIRQWLVHAQQWNRPHVLAETEIHNQASWSLFLKEGLEIVRVGKSPVDGADVYNVREGQAQEDHKPTPERIKYAVAKTLGGITGGESAELIRCPVADIEEQKRHFQDGYIVSGMDKAADMLMMEKRTAKKT